MKTSIKYIAVVLLVVFNFSFTQKENDGFAFRDQNNQAFTFGEKLEYRVHYGWINAARITMKVDDTATIVNDRPTYRIVAKGKTNKSFDWMYTVRDHFETYVDSVGMAPLKYFKTVREDNYRDKDLVYYNHETKKLRGLKKDMDMPQYVQDVVSGTYYARTIDFSDAYVGKTYPLDIYLDQKIYNLKFKYLGKETIKSDFGKVKCIKLRPQLVVDRVFKDEDDMTVWVSDDDNRIPIRIQTDIWIGALKVDLNSYSGLKSPFTAKVK
ncbi:MAG: DUF3108 domain-containing protein [Bacteroidia bacterium]|nr:DUF3108 domain-containing protein [Bacteroidia bacterium]